MQPYPAALGMDGDGHGARLSGDPPLGVFLIFPTTNCALAFPEAFQKPCPHAHQDSFGSCHCFPAAGTIQIHSVATDPDGWLDEFAVIDNRTVITGSFNWSPSVVYALYTYKDCMPAGLNRSRPGIRKAALTPQPHKGPGLPTHGSSLHHPVMLPGS